MKTFFTSDQHYWHTNVIKYCNRPYATVEEMNEDLIKRHNATVAPGDLVYPLGDFSLSRRAVETVLPRLNGQHILIAGNHDHCHPIHAKKEEKLLRMVELYKTWGFQEIETELHLVPNDTSELSLPDSIKTAHQRPIDQILLLNHLPYTGDHYGEPRFLARRPKNMGFYLLHGHVHTAWRKRRRQINVGVDQWDYSPVSIEKILDLIAKGEDHNE